MRRFLIVTVVALATAVLAGPAVAAPTATPYGGATVEDGILKLVSNTTAGGPAGDDFSGATITDVGVTTFSSITHLSTEYNVTDDGCGGGSPRFQIGVQTPGGEKNIHVYFGTPPSFTCTLNTWDSTSNLIGSADLRFDTTQLGGPFYDTYAHALTLAGTYNVTAIKIVVDSGWFFADKEQTVLIRNLQVNNHRFFKLGGPSAPPGQSMSPAKACAKLRAAIGVPAFKLMWGTNANRSNAFGKCVAHHAKLKNDAARTAEVAAQVTAGKACIAVHGKPVKAKGKAKIKLTACLKLAR